MKIGTTTHAKGFTPYTVAIKLENETDERDFILLLRGAQSCMNSGHDMAEEILAHLGYKV